MTEQPLEQPHRPPAASDGTAHLPARVTDRLGLAPRIGAGGPV
ncbi:sirohydrochlorin chelatase, partial [Streptomyces griseus]|nr:sirohydrochlorin chelatase [Streptomyces griseus]